MMYCLSKLYQFPQESSHFSYCNKDNIVLKETGLCVWIIFKSQTHYLHILVVRYYILINSSVHVTGKPEGPPLYGQQPTYIMNGPSSIHLSLTVTKTASSVHFLTRSQRKCAFPDESPSHIHCERIHVKNAFKSKCDCLPWFYASYRSEDCPLMKYQCLSQMDSKQVL